MSGFYKPRGSEMPPMQVKEVKETVAEIETYPFLVNKDRGIRDEVYKYLGYRMKLDPKDGSTPIAAYYPIRINGMVKAWKKRDYLKPKKHAFSIIGNADYSADLIGADKLKPGKKIYITEGEEDLAATLQALGDNIKSNPKWKGKIWPNVVSIVGGAPYAAENITHNMHIIDRYEEVVTCFDSDKCTRQEYNKGYRRGYEATCETHLAIGFNKCKYLPMDLKDPSEYLQTGKQADFEKLLVWGAIDFTPVTIENGDDYSVEDLRAPNTPGVPIRCLPKTSGIIRGLREYEATLVLAPSKSGKSTLTKQIGYDVMCRLIEEEDDRKVGHIFLEENGKKTRQSYIALDTGVSLARLREDPTVLSEREFQKSYDKLYASGKNIFLSTREGKLSPEQVVTQLRYMYAKGCRVIIFDHLSMVVSGSDNGNERKEIDNLLTEIAAFCEGNPVHVIVVAHVKRSDYRPKTDDDGDVIYPYWHPVGPEDARGSAAFSQLFWNCICIEPEICDEAGNINRVRTKVAFCREWGSRGIGDTMKYNPDNGRLEIIGGGE